MEYETCDNFLCTVPEDEVRRAIERDDRHMTHVTSEGPTLKLSMRRLKLYFEQDRACVRCGRRGTVWAVTEIVHEKGSELHLDLYDVSDGEMIMMTRDHIIPRSCGGKDDPTNLQVMCKPCNTLKLDHMTPQDIQEAIRRGLTIPEQALENSTE